MLPMIEPMDGRRRANVGHDALKTLLDFSG
jgi:hypothetical protein